MNKISKNELERRPAVHVGNYSVLLKTLMVPLNGRFPGWGVGRLDAKVAHNPT